LRARVGKSAGGKPAGHRDAENRRADQDEQGDCNHAPWGVNGEPRDTG
jgi:hypothetical protein